MEFIRENVSQSDNYFYSIGNIDRFPYPRGDDSLHQRTSLGCIRLLYHMYRCDRIILHSLFDIRVVLLLYCNPWLLEKCYWVMWGGDYFNYMRARGISRRRFFEVFRRPVIRNMGHLVTYIPGSIEIVRDWYGAKGEYHECLAYPSNTCEGLAEEPEAGRKEEGTIDILVGNSADPTNQHFEVLEKLSLYANGDIRIYAPLSYGNRRYARAVIDEGRRLFGDKFVPLTEMLPDKEYRALLQRIDIAVFNHDRQQAMGTIINLLGMGKKVYMRTDIRSWDLLREKGIRVYDVASLDVRDGQYRIEENIDKVRQYFSRENLLRQWARILND